MLIVGNSYASPITKKYSKKYIFFGDLASGPPRVRKTDTFIVFYLFVLQSVTCLKTCHFATCLTILWTSISVFYVKTARDVVTVLLIFAKYLSLYLHIFTCKYRGTHTQAHTGMYNQHTRGMATTRHRSLVERGGRKMFSFNQVGSILGLGLSKVTVPLSRQCRTGTESFF